MERKQYFCDRCDKEIVCERGNWPRSRFKLRTYPLAFVLPKEDQDGWRHVKVFTINKSTATKSDWEDKSSRLPSSSSEFSDLCDTCMESLREWFLTK